MVRPVSSGLAQNVHSYGQPLAVMIGAMGKLR